MKQESQTLHLEGISSLGHRVEGLGLLCAGVFVGGFHSGSSALQTISAACRMLSLVSNRAESYQSAVSTALHLLSSTPACPFTLQECEVLLLGLRIWAWIAWGDRPHRPKSILADLIIIHACMHAICPTASPAHSQRSIAQNHQLHTILHSIITCACAVITQTARQNSHSTIWNNAGSQSLQFLNGCSLFTPNCLATNYALTPSELSSKTKLLHGRLS